MKSLLDLFLLTENTPIDSFILEINLILFAINSTKVQGLIRIKLTFFYVKFFQKLGLINSRLPQEEGSLK